MLWASQVAPGNENALKLRVYGEKGGLEWEQEDPNYSVVHTLRRAEAAHHARWRGLGRRGGACHPHAARTSRRLSRGLRQDLSGGRARYPRRARRRSRSRPTWSFRPSRTALPAWPSSMPACAHRRPAAAGSKFEPMKQPSAKGALALCLNSTVVNVSTVPPMFSRSWIIDWPAAKPMCCVSPMA